MSKQSPITRSVVEYRREHTTTATVRVPPDVFHVELFTHYGTHDPAGLCDGGDYHHMLKIRLEGAGTRRQCRYSTGEDGWPIVECFWREGEDGELKSRRMSYRDFWELVTKALADSKETGDEQ